MRCFAAVELSKPLRDALADALKKMPREPEVRWSGPEQLHVTLKFLGEVADKDLPRVCEIVQAAAASLAPFSIQLGGFGVFPAPRNPRVLWAGIEDPDAGCRRWLDAVDPRFEEMGFTPELRAYRPHVTLGRAKSSRGAAVLRQVLETAAPPPAREMRVEQIVLFESILRPQGAKYAPALTARLGQAIE